MYCALSCGGFNRMMALAVEGLQRLPVGPAASAREVDRRLAHVRHGAWHVHWEGFLLALDRLGFGRASKSMGLVG